jgi:hypothetical protein
MDSNLSTFFHRQFFTCLKVLKNVLKWKYIFNDNVLKQLAINCLLKKYIMLGFASMKPNMNTVSIIEYVTLVLNNNVYRFYAMLILII